MCILSGTFTLAGFVSHVPLHGSWFEAVATGEGVEGHVFPLVSKLLYRGAVFTGGWFVFPQAWAAVRRHRADMDLLMDFFASERPLYLPARWRHLGKTGRRGACRCNRSV
jgi:cation transport ATPase